MKAVATDVSSPSERERILQATLDLCAAQGYGETTVEQIVERAGVRTETFAAHFDSKEAGLLAAHEAIMAEVLSVVSIAYSPDRSEWDSVIAGTKAVLEMMAAKPSAAYVGFITARQTGPASVHENYQAGGRALAAMIDRGRSYSASGGQPATAARAVLGGAEAVVRREIVAGRAAQLPRLLPSMVYAVTAIFLGQDEALRLSRQARELLRGTEWE